VRNINISAGAVLLLAALYYFAGLISLAALFIAALVHEAGHIAALMLCRVPISGFSFTASGMCMRIGGFTDSKKQLFCLLAGPAAGFAFSYLASAYGNFTGLAFFLETAGFSFILSCYNLLPAMPLDGGRILSCILCDILTLKNAETAIEYVGMLTAILLTVAGLILLKKEFGPAVLFSGIYLLMFQSGLVKSGDLL